MSAILIVDDNPLDRRLAAKCLEAEGTTLLFAENGREALDLLARDRPDAVLTDLDMPEMNGLQLVRAAGKAYPGLPVVLMTAKGSEEVAAEALRAGAASYVPKRNLKRELAGALGIVLDAVASRKSRQQVLGLMTRTESEFVLGYESTGPSALVGYCQDALRMMRICGDGDLVRVGTALREAITNAVEHGNLGLDSKLREEGSGEGYYELGRRRAQEPAYKDRRVRFTARLTPAEATFVVSDDGPGFDPASLPDPTDPENLMLPHGRGLMLIRTFMDDVRFNATGNEITMIKDKMTF